jgi:hypothetical protein
MPLGRAMRVRARFWVLLAVTVVFVFAVRALFVNFERVGIYSRSRCEYRPDGAWTWFSDPGEPDPDGWTHTPWPEGSLELTRPDPADPTPEQYRMYDPQGVLRVERVRGRETTVLPARYFDAHGRLVAKGGMRAGARVGIWDVYDVVGPGHRWIWFGEG